MAKRKETLVHVGTDRPVDWLVQNLSRRLNMYNPASVRTNRNRGRILHLRYTLAALRCVWHGEMDLSTILQGTWQWAMSNEQWATSCLVRKQFSTRWSSSSSSSSSIYFRDKARRRISTEDVSSVGYVQVIYQSNNSSSWRRASSSRSRSSVAAPPPAWATSAPDACGCCTWKRPPSDCPYTGNLRSSCRSPAAWNPNCSSGVASEGRRRANTSRRKNTCTDSVRILASRESTDTCKLEQNGTLR